MLLYMCMLCKNINKRICPNAILLNSTYMYILFYIYIYAYVFVYIYI